MNTLSIQTLSPDLSVAPQLLPDAMPALAEAGFKSVINNRPDFEGGPDQPTAADNERAALAAGLVYRHLPVQGAFQTPEEIQAFARLLQELPKPILAFCRTGTRSSRLYAQALDL